MTLLAEGYTSSSPVIYVECMVFLISGKFTNFAKQIQYFWSFATN